MVYENEWKSMGMGMGMGFRERLGISCRMMLPGSNIKGRSKSRKGWQEMSYWNERELEDTNPRYSGRSCGRAIAFEDLTEYFTRIWKVRGVDRSDAVNSS